MGLLGTVLGLVLLTIGLWRSHVGPRWVPPALLAFMLVEFVGTAITPWAAAVGGTLQLAAFGALALTIVRSPLDSWTVGTSDYEPDVADAGAQSVS